jgi:hypothetical protein
VTAFFVGEELFVRQNLLSSWKAGLFHSEKHRILIPKGFNMNRMII